MRYQLLPGADHGGQSGPDERTVVAIGERPASGTAGTAGLQWLWGLVELSLGPDEPGTAA